MKKALFAVGMLFPLAVFAQSFDAKPGLWENTVTTEIAGMPAMPAMDIPQDALDKMPAAQRAQIENMMKGRGGGTPRTTTTKTCLTAESMRGSMYHSTDKSCTTKVVTATSSTQKVHIECSPSGMTTVGDLTVERVDTEHFKGVMMMKSTGPATGGDAARSMDMKMTIAGKWLSSDCGSVKPFDPNAPGKK